MHNALHPILRTDAQKGRERLALRLLDSGPVRREMARLQEYFRSEAGPVSSSSLAALAPAIGSIALAAIFYALSEDGARPVLTWAVNAAHGWSGLDVPRSGYGIGDNPDNVYRQTAIDGASSYLIRGRFRGSRPVQQTFVLYSRIPGLDPVVFAEGAPVIAVLRSDQMQFEDDGSFAVTIDGQPANGRTNHIRSSRQAKLLLVRDTLADWNSELPPILAIERLGGPPGPAPASETVLAVRTAEILASMGPYWLRYIEQEVLSLAVNSLPIPALRDGNWAMASVGHFHLSDDRALMVTLDPVGSAYLGIQLTDRWGVTVDYVGRCSSLNLSQAAPNPDGSCSYFIAGQDAGVHNWLDTGGLSEGLIAVRWQDLAGLDRMGGAVRETRVVEIAEIGRMATPVPPSQRMEMLQQRARAYSNRLQ